MALEEVPRIPDRLLKILPSGKTVIFLGAGISRLLNYPSWAQLAERCLKHLADASDINFSHADSDVLKTLHPRQRLSIAVDIWKERGKEPKHLIKIGMMPRGEAASKAFELLASLNLPFITTNYDDCLINAIPKKPLLENSPESPSTAQTIPALSRRPISGKDKFLTTELAKSNTLIYLHGRLEDSSPLIVTTREYVEHYRDPVVQEFLDHLFNNYHVLFIGYGLEEEEIIDFIVRKKPAGNETNHFRLTPAYSHEETLIRHLGNYYRNHCSVETVPYRIDGAGHCQLEKVLEEWIPVIRERTNPINFIEKTKMILDVVLENDKS